MTSSGPNTGSVPPGLRIPFRLLRLLSPLVPSRHRQRWLREWRAELWYGHRSGRDGLSRSPGAIPHAVALRWQESRPEMTFLDLRYAFRQLRRSPGFTGLVVLTLGLGIGANTLVYSVLQSTVLSPLDLPRADRIVYLWQSSENNNMQVPPTLDQIEAWREQVDGLEEIHALDTTMLTLTGRGDPARLSGARATRGFFDFVGTSPALGRSFSAAESAPGGEAVVVLSHGLWQQAFGGSEQILGESMILDDKPHVVIGVLPAGFRLQQPLGGRDLWLPLTDPTPGRSLNTIARLAPEASVEAVNEELAALATAEADDGGPFAGWKGVARPPQGMVSGRYRTVLWSIQGAVLFVLLIAGANTANLLLARGSKHRRELAVRSALGAGRGRLVRQLLLESTLLALAGGALGLALTWAGRQLLMGLRPADLSSFQTLRLDPIVLWATLGVSLACGLLFGLVPAIQACRGRLAEDLTEGSRTGGDGARGSRLRSALVVAEVALATLLLVGAGLLVRSFVQLQGVDPGFEPEGVLAARVALPEQRYEAATAEEFWRELQRRLETALGPKLESMTIASGVPPSLSITFGAVVTDAGPVPEDRVGEITTSVTASPEYFATLETRFVEGGPFPDQRVEGERYAVLDESYAAKLWPDGSAVGRRFRYETDEASWITVTGVVESIRGHGLDSSGIDQQIFTDWGWEDNTSNWLALRVVGDPLDAAGMVREQARRLEPDAVVDGIATLEEKLGDSIALQRFNAQVMVGFAGLAVLLAVVGIYGVLSYSIASRTGELGVRVALGASRTRVLRLVSRQGLGLVALGLIVGLAAATGLGRFLESQLYGVETIDPLTYVAVATLFCLVGLLATGIPALRATRVDPVIALRAE